MIQIKNHPSDLYFVLVYNTQKSGIEQVNIESVFKTFLPYVDSHQP